MRLQVLFLQRIWCSCSLRHVPSFHMHTEVEPSTALVPVQEEAENTETTTEAILEIMDVSPPSKIVVREPTEEELPALLAKMGLAALPLTSYKSTFVKSVTTRLTNREGKALYQSAAYNLPLFPRSAAEPLFPSSLLATTEDGKTLTWRATTQPEVATLLGSSAPRLPTSPSNFTQYPCSAFVCSL